MQTEIAHQSSAPHNSRARGNGDWSGVGAIHINPTFFAEDLYLFTGGSIRRDGKIRLPFGDEGHATAAAWDIARAVVAALEEPQALIGQRIVLTGPENLTMKESAETISSELGTLVEYVDLPIPNGAPHWSRKSECLNSWAPLWKREALQGLSL